MKTIYLYGATVLLALAELAHAQQPAPPPQQWTPKVINGGLPSVSPDGKRIAFMALRDVTKPPNIFTVAVDGSDERQVTRNGGGGAAQWIGANKILYEGQGKVVVASLDGGESPLTTPEGRGFVPSPDGKWLAFSTGRMPTVQLMVSAFDGSGARALTNGPGMAFNGVFSPDGKRIAYARMDSTRDMQIWVVNADGTGARQVTHFDGTEGRPQWPSWSPDGKTVAVQAGIGGGGPNVQGTAHIWLVDIATGQSRKLAPHTPKYLDETPSFFPDGKRIAFQSDRTGRMEIWVMNVDGTGARQLTK